jgi:uncharacterized repeat protein (TIGR01451 family)
VSFAPGTLLDDVYVTVTPSSVSAPSGVTAASPAYDLVAYNANGDIVERFGGTAELTISYASATPPSIYFLSPTDGAIQLDTRVDPAAQTVQAWLVHFSTYVAATPLDDIANRPPVTDVTVAVTVVAPGGAAIVDALVQATSDTGYEVRGRTDSAGTISLGVSRGLWIFRVDGVSNLQAASQALDTTSGGISYTVALGLSDFPVYVTGTVRDSGGNPLAGVRVDARSESGAVRADDFAISGADGGYRLGGLIGQWSISGQDVTDYYPQALESHYTPAASHAASLAVTGSATQDLTYTLMPRQLTGNLKDQNGNGVAGGAVQLEVYSQTFDFHFSATVISAPDGSYTARLPSDVFRVDIRAQLQPAGYGDVDVEATTWNAPSLDTGAAVVIPDFHYYKFSTSASGVVHADPGYTIGGYTVAAEFYSTLRARWFWIEATTDANGAWTIAGDPGDWNVYPLTSVAGYSADTIRGLAVGAAGITDVEVLLVAGTAVAGTVTFQDTGATAAGVGIEVCGFSCAVTKTNSLGEYLAWLAVDPLTRSSDGTVQLLTGKTGYARSSAAISGTAGGRLAHDLLYVAFTTSYSGTVLDSFGTPVPGAVVRLTDGVDEALLTVQTDGTWAGFGPDVEAEVSATGVFPTSGNSQVLIASAGSTDLVLLLPATRLAGTVTDDLGTALSGVTIDAERWLCNFGAAHCDWADLFGSFYGLKISTVASTVTDSSGSYEFTLDPALFSDNFPLRLSAASVARHVTPGLLTPTYLPGQVTDADFVYVRALLEIQGVADGGVYGGAVTPVIVTTPAFDAVEVTLNGVSWTPGAISADGTYTIVARALRSGTEAARATVTFSIDTVAPVVSIGGVADGGAYPAAVTPDILATDATLAFTTMTLDGSPFGGGAITTEGRHVLVVTATDWAANAASATVVFLIDLTAPTTTLTTNPASGPFGDHTLFTLDASDDGSGVQSTYWLLDDGTANLYSAPFSLVGLAGPHTLSWYSTDLAGNTEAAQSASLAFSSQADLVLSKTVAPTAALVGAQIVYRFDVRNDGPQTAQNVEFLDHVDAPVEFVGIDVGTSFGSCSWLAASRTVSCSSASLAPGAAVTAAFRFRTTTLGTFTNTATVTSTTTDPSPANNTDSVTLDVVPAAPSRPDLLAADDSGLSSTDKLTNVTRPRFSVTTAARLLVELVEAGTVLGSAFANDLGVAVVQVDLPLADGLHAIAARARVNALSTPSTLSTALSVRIDTVAPTAPVLDLPPAEDTGLSNTDNVTNFTTWHIYASSGDGTVVVTTEVAPNGRVTTFEAPPSRPFTFLPDTGGGLGPDQLQGTWTYQAKGVDLAGNVSALSNVLAISFDSVAPAAPVLDLREADDSGASTTDNVTNAGSWHIFASFDDAVSLFTREVAPDGRVVTSTVAPDAVFSPNQQGTWTYQAHSTDLAGNVSDVSNVLAITYDSIAPSTPVLDLRADQDSGASDTDNVTNSVVFDFGGLSEPGASVRFSSTDGFTASYEVAADGSWAIQLSSVDELPGSAPRTWSAYAADPAGNESAVSQLTLVIDRTAPAAPVLDLPAAQDSGVSNTDNVTNVGTWDLFASVGDAVALPTVELAPDGVEEVFAGTPHSLFVPDQQGTWTYQSRGVDLAGNVSAPSNILVVTYDSIAPAAPARPDLRTANDSGVFGDDDVTNVARPGFDTTDETGALLMLFVDSVAYTGTADLADGAHSVTATATDLAGNVSAVSEALTVTVDTTTPAGAVVLASGAAGTRDPDVRAAVSFTDVLAPYQLRFSLDGGATWSDWQAYTTDLPLTLPGADAVKTVLVEVRDLAGNVGSASDDIRLDRAGPTITIASPAAGAVVDVAQIVALVFTAVDPSGIRSTSATLDGRPLAGSLIDTLLLAFGTHTLVVTAVDTLGNVSTSTVTFDVRATIPGLVAAVRRAAAAGLIDRREVQKLLADLDDAARELDRGDRRDAARALRNFAAELLDEAGRRVDRAFADRAAGWALELADRISPQRA